MVNPGKVTLYTKLGYQIQHLYKSKVEQIKWLDKCTLTNITMHAILNIIYKSKVLII